MTFSLIRIKYTEFLFNITVTMGRGTQYRSNLQSILKEIILLDLSKQHKAQLKKSPFWLLVKSILNQKLKKSMCRKSDELLQDLISRYDSELESFHIGRTELKITENDIRLIFGIKDGPVKIEVAKKGKQESDFASRLRSLKTNKRKNELTKNVINGALHKVISGSAKEEIEDVARLINLLLLNTLFVPTRTDSMAWGYAKLVEDIEGMVDYNWSAHILETLTTSLQKHSKTPESATGCLMVLPVSSSITLKSYIYC